MPDRPERATVLVTGATGVLGRSLTRHLVARGKTVRALVRMQVGPDVLPPEVEQAVGDLRDPVAVRRAVAGTEAVFHLGALLHIADPPPNLITQYEAINVGGTRHVAEAVAQESVPTLVLASTIDVYGPTNGGLPWTEESPTNGTSMYARSKLQAEQVALSTAPTTVLRLAAVYGPEMKGNYIRLVDALSRKRFVMVGDGRNRRTLVHITDATNALAMVPSLAHSLHRLYNVTDGTSPTLREIVVAICDELDIPRPRVRVPKGFAVSTASLAERLIPRHRLPAAVSTAAVRKITEDMAVTNHKIESELGVAPTVTQSEGWRTVL